VPAGLEESRQSLSAVPPHAGEEHRYVILRPVLPEAFKKRVDGRAIGIIAGVLRVVKRAVRSEDEVVVGLGHQDDAGSDPHPLPGNGYGKRRL